MERAHDVTLWVHDKGLPQERIDIVYGDTVDVVRIQAMDNPGPVDLTGKTLFLAFRSEGQRAIRCINNVEITDALDGRCRYVIAPGEVLPGLTVAELTICDTDEQRLTPVMTWVINARGSLLEGAAVDQQRTVAWQELQAATNAVKQLNNDAAVSAQAASAAAQMAEAHKATAAEKAAQSLASAQQALDAAAAAGISRDEAQQYQQQALAHMQAALGYMQQAQTAAAQSVQAMTDLLRMIDKDICPLVNDQVPFDRLPAAGRYENMKIEDESELVGLIAEKNDKASIIVDGKIVKTYELLGDDPTVRANWVEYNTSYATQAGYADTAGVAADSNKVGGVRVAIFQSIEEMTNAVKVSGTLYLAPFTV